MRYAYIRPEPKCTADFQRKFITASERRIAVEQRRGRDSPYPEFEDLLKKALRDGDELELSHFHRIASTTDAMFDHAKRVVAKGVVITETSSKRMSDSPAQLLEMAQEAVRFYAGRSLSSEEARRLGELGAAASPAARRKEGRMPHDKVQVIMNDHDTYPTVKMALAAINADKRYKDEWSQAHLYREAKEGRLELRRRKAGPRDWSRQKYRG